MRQTAILLASLWLSCVATSCRKQAENNNPEDKSVDGIPEVLQPPITVPDKPPTPPAPPPSPEPMRARLFVASGNSRIISMYTMEGGLVGYIDLTSYGEGFVTAMAWLDNQTLLAFMDPGSSGERIAKISFSSDTTYTINSNWHADTSNLVGVSVTKMFSPGFSVSPLVFIAKNSSSLEAIATNSSFSVATRAGTPFISNTAACPLSVTAMVSRTANGRIILASNGSQTRLNVYSIDKTCLSSYNFSTTFPGTSGYVVNGLASSKDNVFVRYQHATSPMIAKCSFDGTVINSCESLLNDSSFLGLNSSSRELIFDETTNSLYFPNWALGSIMQLNPASGYVAPLIRNSFTTNVASMSIRPK